MIHPLDASRSALRAFSQKTNVIANNVANVNTDGFKKSRTTLEEGPTGGVNARISHYTSLVDVYRSMGGGWVDDASVIAPTPQEVMSQER